MRWDSNSLKVAQLSVNFLTSSSYESIKVINLKRLAPITNNKLSSYYNTKATKQFVRSYMIKLITRKCLARKAVHAGLVLASNSSSSASCELDSLSSSKDKALANFSFSPW